MEAVHLHQRLLHRLAACLGVKSLMSWWEMTRRAPLLARKRCVPSTAVI